MGLVPLGAGLLLLLIAFLDPRDGAFASGRGPVAAAGVVFGLAGLAVVIDGFDTPYRGALLALNATVLMGAFACVPLGIAWSGGLSWQLAVSGGVCLTLAGVSARAALRQFAGAA